LEQFHHTHLKSRNNWGVFNDTLFLFFIPNPTWVFGTFQLVLPKIHAGAGKLFSAAFSGFAQPDGCAVNFEKPFVPVKQKNIYIHKMYQIK
jgi:hypothetical protein